MAEAETEEEGFEFIAAEGLFFVATNYIFREEMKNGRGNDKSA